MKTAGLGAGDNAQAMVSEDHRRCARPGRQRRPAARPDGHGRAGYYSLEMVSGEEVELGAVLAGYWSEANAETETAEAELLIATRKDHRH